MNDDLSSLSASISGKPSATKAKATAPPLRVTPPSSLAQAHAEVDAAPTPRTTFAAGPFGLGPKVSEPPRDSGTYAHSVSIPDAPAPARDFLTKAGNVMETPLTFLGALQMDLAAGRQPFDQNGDAAKGTSIDHAAALMASGDWQRAVQLYSTTSLDANKIRGELGDRGAKWLQQHPSIFSTLAMVEEFANPSNILAGKVGGAVTEGLGKKVSFNRFKDIRDAAEEAPSQRAAAPEQQAAREASVKAAQAKADAARAQAARDAHFAQKQADSAQAAKARAHYAGQPPPQPSVGVRSGQPELAPAGERVEPPGPEMTAYPNRPSPVRPGLPGAPLPALEQGFEGYHHIPEPAAGQPALPGAPQAALPPGGATELPMQQQLSDLISREKTAAKARSIENDPYHGQPPMVGQKPPVEGPPSHLAGNLPIAPPVDHPALPPAGERVLPSGPPITVGPQRPAFPPASERLNPGVKGITTPGGALTPVGESGAAPGAVRPEPPIAADAPVPKDIADRAEMVGRRMALIDKWARHGAQSVTRLLYQGRGIRNGAQQSIVRAIEGTHPVANAEDVPRIAQYRSLNHRLARMLKAWGIADPTDPEQIWDPDKYHPRSGAALETDVDEPEPGTPESVAPGTKGIRKGTLKIKRLFDTLHDMENSGIRMNPEWQPARTLERTWHQRLMAIGLEQQVRELENLGLIQDAGKPVPEGWLTVHDDPQVARFGSPTLNSGASMHPAVAKLVRDITHADLDPERALSTPMQKFIGKPLAAANSLLARFEVANPIFHPAVNVGPNQLAALLTKTNPLKSLPAYAKELFTVEGAQGPKDYLQKLVRGEGLESAQRAGVAVPYASAIDSADLARPFSDLSPAEKIRRAALTAGHGVEKLTSEPLYRSIEPRMARAFYKAAQAGGMSEPEAAIMARQTLGEPENLGAAERPYAQAAMFPHWRKGMMRLWPKLLAQSPALYAGPHRGAQAYNESRGMSPQGLDASRFIPEIATGGKDDQGNPQYWEFPSPADIPLRAINMAGNAVSGEPGLAGNEALRLGLSVVNPLINTGLRSGLTAIGKAGDPNTGLGGYRIVDKDAPNPYLQSLTSVFERYRPIRSNATGPLEAVGLGLTSNPTDDQRQLKSSIESRFRKNIEKLRYAAQDARKANDPATAGEYEQQADALYQEMGAYLKEAGFGP